MQWTPKTMAPKTPMVRIRPELLRAYSLRSPPAGATISVISTLSSREGSDDGEGEREICWMFTSHRERPGGDFAEAGCRMRAQAGSSAASRGWLRHAKYGTFDAAGQVLQRPGGRGPRPSVAGQLTPRTSPPGWQVRQKEVMRWLAVISEMGVPQRGQGCPPRKWTAKKSRGLRWTSSPISWRTFSIESVRVWRMAWWRSTTSSAVNAVRLR